MTAQLDHIAQRVATPGRLGQATAVEQSRAVAEVQGAIVVAQQVPRDITRAVTDMQRSCAQKSLAERAFFRFPRGKDPDTGKTLYISGPSVQLARELARCFGNMQFGLVELRRDDAYGQSEMQAWAWDVQTNTRSSTTFIVQHVRDTRKGTLQLTDQRDIYENNANNGARRLREMIFAILPGWYTEDAVAACYETLAADDGDEGTLADRVAKAIEGFATRKVTAAQLEQKLGAPQSRWTPYDLAQLSVIYRSIQRGEIRVEDEFPAAAARLTPADITGQHSKPAGQPSPAETPSNEGAKQEDPGPAVPDGTPGSGPAAGPGATPAKPSKPSKAATERLTTLLRHIPLGDHEDVTALLAAWTSKPDFLDQEMTAADVKLVTGILEDALHEAGDNPELAASHIWAARNQSGKAAPSE